MSDDTLFDMSKFDPEKFSKFVEATKFTITDRDYSIFSIYDIPRKRKGNEDYDKIGLTDTEYEIDDTVTKSITDTEYLKHL